MLVNLNVCLRRGLKSFEGKEPYRDANRKHFIVVILGPFLSLRCTQNCEGEWESPSCSPVAIKKEASGGEKPSAQGCLRNHGFH